MSVPPGPTHSSPGTNHSRNTSSGARLTVQKPGQELECSAVSGTQRNSQPAGSPHRSVPTLHGENQTSQHEDAVQSTQQERNADPDTSNRADENQSHGVVVNVADLKTDDLVHQKRKKRKSRRPASKRGLEKPTGFEDNYADAPMTSEQYAEIQEMYHPDMPFVERILRAIQRFERTRKLSPERRDVFYKYLAYGGIDIGPNMFQGAQDTKSMSTDEATETMAQANLSEEFKAQIKDVNKEGTDYSETSQTLQEEHKEKYEVDFEITMRAFLSRRAQVMFGFESQERVDLVTTTLERFMDYLMQNEVSPEYYAQILATRNICRNARTELWSCAEAQRRLPGDFNIACSRLFGGMYSQYDGTTYWGESNADEKVFVGFTNETASQIMGFAVAGAASEDVYQHYSSIMEGIQTGNGAQFTIVQTFKDHGFEIVEICGPTPQCLELYERNTVQYQAVGTVYAKFWRNPDASPVDLTEEERKFATDAGVVPGAGFDSKNDAQFVFFVEKPLLMQHLRVGQKVEATVCRLNCGLWFFDEVLKVLPTFDAWIENEMMIGWKEPKPLRGALDYNALDEEDGEGEEDE